MHVVNIRYVILWSIIYIFYFFCTASCWGFEIVLFQLVMWPMPAFTCMYMMQSSNSLSFSLFPHSFLQDADKLYKGHLSEFTPLSSLHAPPARKHDRRGNESQNHTHRRSDSSPPKKLMCTYWGGRPDYCTFSSFLRIGENPRFSGAAYAYSTPGPETSVW